MRNGRYYHGCFSVKERGNVTKVYVFGGDNGSAMKSTEMLNVIDLKWSDGPSLPFPMYGNAGVPSVTDSYHGFSVGGITGYNGTYLKTVLGLENSNRNQRWVEVGSLKEPRRSHTVVNTPTSLLNFC